MDCVWLTKRLMTDWLMDCVYGWPRGWWLIKGLCVWLTKRMIMYLMDCLIEGLCGADQEIDYCLMECVLDWFEGLCIADQETDHVFDGWYDWLIEGLCVVDQETDHVYDGLWWIEGLCVADQEIDHVHDNCMIGWWKDWWLISLTDGWIIWLIELLVVDLLPSGLLEGWSNW